MTTTERMVVYRVSPETATVIAESVQRLRSLVLSAGLAIRVQTVDGTLDYVDIHNAIQAAEQWLLEHAA